MEMLRSGFAGDVTCIPSACSPLDHVVPARTISPGAVHEDDGGLGSILLVFAHAFLLGRGVRSRAIAPRPAL
jgi:hypothetical protein